MPTKTGEKIRIIVLGNGSDADTARAIAESDPDVALAAKFTKTVTHLVVDDTIKPSEARVKKAEEAGVPVLQVAEFRALLASGPEDEVEEAPEAEETPVAEAEVPEPEPEVEAEVETPAEEPEVEPEPVAETEPEPEPEATVPAQAEAPKVESEPEIDVIEEPEEEKAEAKSEAPEAASPKPGLVAKLKSIFGLTGARK